MLPLELHFMIFNNLKVPDDIFNYVKAFPALSGHFSKSFIVITDDESNERYQNLPTDRVIDCHMLDVKIPKGFGWLENFKGEIIIDSIKNLDWFKRRFRNELEYILMIKNEYFMKNGKININLIPRESTDNDVRSVINELLWLMVFLRLETFNYIHLPLHEEITVIDPYGTFNLLDCNNSMVSLSYKETKGDLKFYHNFR
ncbi:hypothetical protein BN7_2754 [Wickerhamomyces ciferrii]|uniref:Uncharacterized protein n=1 Tax=Wickerhamomyces ciferrii (strain ATCC 14091 / BCRC 22168 / CBS 111 / JCM 3599 / NBRC 0793 / NRRL Y-1031 F-60-10) TaxID=1206466 RepID=K0KLX5_WICCF|nr:uncharacterized protein BN7_2754 [Wickerhamomyces ciferrii]CCH43207.1 hypothetical protein BN7_2754 [Wickerhamomyces ciferrii]